MSGPASAFAADRSTTRAAVWLHWLWRLAVLGALLWIGWELQLRPAGLPGGATMQLAALSQQVSDTQSRLEDIDGALDDVQDALDRVESAVEDDGDGEDDAISKQAGLRPRVASPAARHGVASTPLRTAWHAVPVRMAIRRPVAPAEAFST